MGVIVLDQVVGNPGELRFVRPYPHWLAAGGPAFSPLSLSPLIWLDATQLTGLANNDPVGTFTDKSGHGNDFTAAGAGRPLYKTSGINGRPALLGDGLLTSMPGPSTGANATWWAFMVSQPVVAPLTGSANFWGIADFPASGGAYIFICTNNTGDSFDYRTAGAGQFDVGALVTGQQFGIYVTGSATTATYQDDMGMAGSNPGNCSRPNVIQRLFNRGDGALCVNALIGECVFGSGTLTAQNVSDMWTYLAAEWGTQIPP